MRKLLCLILLPSLAFSGQLQQKITVNAYMPKQAKIENVSVVNNQVVVEITTNGSSSEVVFSVKKESDQTVSIEF